MIAFNYLVAALKEDLRRDPPETEMHRLSFTGSTRWLSTSESLLPAS
jgi:hypothetical protein